MTDISSLVMAIVLAMAFVAVVAVYFLPALIARYYNREFMVPIFVINLFLGWSIFGWVGALVWSLMPRK